MNSIDVCNLALAYIGNTQPIASMVEQTKGAILCGRFYNLTREQLLKAFPWNFAVKTEDLTEVTTETDDQFAYRYEYPEDCLRVLRVGEEEDGEDTVNHYVVRTVDSNGTLSKRIACDIEDARAKYIFDVQDIEAMPAEFIDVLALSLALRLAGPMVTDARMVQSVQQQYQYSLAIAKQMCAMEQRQPMIKENKYSSARW